MAAASPSLVVAAAGGDRMPLNDFPRYPLMFGPSPVHPAGSADRSIWAERRSGRSGRTATPGSPTAATRSASWSTWCRTRWRRERTRWCRSAGCSPTTPGRSPRSRPGSASGPCWSRRAGWTGRTRSTTGSATSCCPGSWAPTCGWSRRSSGSASNPAGSRRWMMSAPPAGPRTPSRPGPRTTGWAAWASRTGRTKSSSRKATWGSSSTPSWCAALPGRLRRG